MYKGIIFDLDGTLLNTIDDIKNSLNIALVEVVGYKCSCEQCKYFVGSGVNKLIERALKYFDCYNFDNFEKVKTRYLLEYKKSQSNCTLPYPGIIELLTNLNEKKIKIGVLSNKPDDDTKKIVENYFNSQYFDIVWGKKQEYEVKPNPESLNAMINKLGLNKKDIIYCGDSDVDIQTAKNAKIDCIAVTWGFRKKEELERLNPEYIVQSTEEIISVLEMEK